MDDFRKLIQIVENNSEIKKEGGLSEGAGEVVKKVFKHKGKPVGEIGVDLASSPGGGMYYMKYYGSGRAVSGYDSMEEAFAELKHYLNQMKEGATGETESILVNEFMDTDNKFGRGDGGNEPIPVYHSKKPNKVIGYVYKDEYGWNSEAVNSELGHSHIDSKLEAIQDVHEMYNEWVHQKKYSKLINGRWTTIPAPDDAYSDPPKNEGAIGETESMPVTESKWEVAIEYGPTASHTTKIKVSAPDADTAQTKALSIFKKKFPDRRGMVGDYTELK